MGDPLESTPSVKQCDVCERQTSVKCCSACKRRWYCSIECQKTEWKTHKITCREVKRKNITTSEDVQNHSPSSSSSSGFAAPPMFTMIGYRIDESTLECKKVTCSLPYPKDEWIQDDTEGIFCLRSYACWIPENTFDTANNWAIWRTTCFLGEKVQFSVYFQRNRAIVEPADYFSYDAYFSNKRHATLGILSNPVAQSTAIPRLLVFAKQYIQSRTSTSICDA